MIAAGTARAAQAPANALVTPAGQAIIAISTLTNLAPMIAASTARATKAPANALVTPAGQATIAITLTNLAPVVAASTALATAANVSAATIIQVRLARMLLSLVPRIVIAARNGKVFARADATAKLALASLISPTNIARRL